MPNGPTSQALSAQSLFMSTGTGGYTCASCGVWASYGVTHVCPSLNYYTGFNYGWNLGPTVSKFKGTVKALDDLPADATVGDAYFIEKAALLVVRVTNGWHCFDREA